MDRYRLAPLALRVRAKEDRCSKYLLKGRPKTAALSSSLLHPEGVEHFSRAAKPNYSTLLPDGERSQKDRDEPVLTPRQSVRGVPGYLKKKVPVPPLVKELSRLRTLYGQSAIIRMGGKRIRRSDSPPASSSGRRRSHWRRSFCFETTRSGR
jgi:hypothetical protein